MRHRAALAIAALVLSSAASADVYRWVDASGRVHYSDRWVEGSELIKTSAPAAAFAKSAQAETQRNQLRASDERIREQQAQSSAAEAVRQDVEAKRAEQCKQARENYEKSIAARRIYKNGPNGERQYLSDAEADEMRIKARASMDALCGKTG
jgi:hypothetical protein